MRIAILSQDASLYSTKRLIEAGEERGHKMHVVNYLRCYMNIASQKPSVVYQGQSLENFDAIIPRIGTSRTFYGTAVVRQFELMGVFSANESQAIARSRDKLRCLQILAREGVKLPVTGFAHATTDVDGLIEIVGGVPLVVKLLEGTQGIGVVLAETYRAATSVIEAFRKLDADTRCFVIADKVVASMKRQGVDGEFRSNLHRGGKAEKIKLTPEERSTAVRSAKAMGLRIAGVDMISSNRGPMVIEVNSSPGLEGIEKTTEIDVAGKIIEFLAKNTNSGKNRSRIQY